MRIKLLLLCLLLVLFPKKADAINLIQNPGFENGVQSWKTNNSGVNFSTVNDIYYEGSQSAKISNSKTSSYGTEQTLTDISGSLTYKIGTYIKLVSPFPEKAFLRVAWYKSTDGSGSQSSTDDSPFPTNTDAWQELSLIKNPAEGISSAKVRLLVASGAAYFDNISFEEYFSPTAIPAATSTPALLTEAVPTPTAKAETPTATPTPTPIPYDNIFLSEIVSYPETGGNEWVEIYNDNDFTALLKNWYLDDTEDSGSSPRIFSLEIPAKSYNTINLNSSIFNNDSDEVRLMDFDKNLKDRFRYYDGEQGKSWGRTSFASADFCLQIPSKGMVNNTCFEEEITEKSLNPTAIKKINNIKSTSSSTKTKQPVAKKYSNYVQVMKKTDLSTINNDKLVNDKGNVLGTDTENTQTNKNFFLIKSLSFSSFSYSLLTIVSLLLRIRK